MKLVKMSLAAALLVSGAYALDNVKVNGSAKLIYQTTDVELATGVTGTSAETGLFTRGQVSGAEAARGGAQVLLGATADLVENVSAGAEVQVFTTLGLENNLVSNVMAGQAANVDTQWAMSQMWMAASLGKTTAKLGRMELDTPLLFTEKWNVIKNTFEGIVLLNSDLPDTTLVGAWVSKHNGVFNGYTAALSTGLGQSDTPYGNFYGGAYAAGIVNTSFENTTLQAWYYNIKSDTRTTGAVSVAGLSNGAVATNGLNETINALWLQADIKNLADLVDLGVQYANVDGNTAGQADTDVWAVRVGGKVSDINLFAAYSSVSDFNDNTENTSGGFANTSTGDKTKIYTGAGSIYMDGVVTAPDTDTWKIGASTKVADYALAANYTSASNGGNGMVNTATNAYDYDVSAWDISVATKIIGLIDLKAIYTDMSGEGINSIYNAPTGAQVAAPYSAADRQTFRIIAGLKF
jgi:hypothetical protein